MSDFRLVIKNKNFVYLWISQILSQVTINIMNFLLLIRIFEHTGSTIATSLLWVSYSIPVIIIGPIAAASVDMIDRRKMLVITNLLQSLTIFFYAFFYEGKLFLLYGITLLYSFINQFYMPAESASLPDVVDTKLLAQANGLFFLTQQAALIIGFGIAGFLNQILGFKFSLIFCATLVFFASLSTFFLPVMKPKESISKGFESTILGFFQKIFDGYRFIKENTKILLPFLILLSTQVVLAMVVVNIPLLAKDIMGMNPNLAGIYLIVPAGVGSIIGAIYIPRFLKIGRRKKIIIEYSYLALSLILASFTFMIPYISGIFKMIFSIVTIFLAGIFFIGVIIPSQTYLQEATPGGLRGRVFGNFWFLVTIATIIPVIFSGAISEVLGIKFLFLIFSIFSFFAFFISKKIGQNLLDKNLSLNGVKKFIK